MTTGYGGNMNDTVPFFTMAGNPPRPKSRRPAGLKRPYEYVLTTAAFSKFWKSLMKQKELLEKTVDGKKLSHDSNGKFNGKFQCAHIAKKPISCGVRLDIFVLGYKLGLTGDQSGVTKPEWDAAVKAVQQILTDALGQDAEAYVQEWNPSPRKFEIRFETYIAFKELL
jgi:hypothetical protein